MEKRKRGILAGIVMAVLLSAGTVCVITKFKNKK